ncbi:hypothetical protein AGMMS50212_15670 [Spirochaetia bacterium]|nr:hypothetical protein AGMMS50212_15670 [Spirochaetia bacterium]
MYWEFFDTFMNCVAYLGIKDKDYTTAKYMLRNTYIEFLAYKLEKFPEISLCLSSELLYIDREHFLMEMQADLDEHFSGWGSNSVWFQARLYVFLHEMFHIFFRSNNSKYREVVNTLQEICRLILKNNLNDFLNLYDENDWDESGKKTNYDTLTSIVEETDLTLIEEVACDFHTFFSIVNFLRDSCKEYNLEKIIDDVQETLRFCSYLQTEFTYTLSLWNETIGLCERQLSSDSSDIETESSEFNKKIEFHKVRCFSRSAVLFQIIQVNCLVQYKYHSSLKDVFSNNDVRSLLFPISDGLKKFRHIIETFGVADALRERGELTKKQQIKAYHQLVLLRKNKDSSFMY